MITSKLDKRIYDSITTENDVAILTVEDNDLTESAIAVTVQCGNLLEPDDMPGLAHLLEHCFFTGSKRYPQHNQINQWLEQQHGAINGWTSAEYTTFYLHIPHEHLLVALDMFIDMLTSPLFSQDGIEKEITAIESEYRAKLKDEQRRLIDVQKQVVNPKHPYSRFSVGNEKLFKQHSIEALQIALSEFHQRFYVGRNVKACVVSQSIAPEVKEAIKQQFSLLRCGKPEEGCDRPSYTNTPLLSESHCARKIQVKSEKNVNRLLLTFQTDCTNEDFRSKPETVVSHLIGHESKGSLLRYWERKGWASAVLAGGGIQGQGFHEFNVSIQLLNLHPDTINGVLASLWHYVSLITNDADITRFSKEKSQLSQLIFNFQSPEPASETAQHLSLIMHNYPEEYWLFGEYVMDVHNTDKIQAFAQQLNFDNLHLFIISQHVETDSQTQFYNVPYSVSELTNIEAPDYLIEEFEQHLRLPEANPYIPDSLFNYVSNESVNEAPKMLESMAPHEIWYGQDSVTAAGRGEVYYSLRKPPLPQCIDHVAKRKLWSFIVNAELEKSFYPARLAGMHLRLYAHQSGIGLHTSGFVEKQLDLLEEIWFRIRTVKISQRQYEPYLEQYRANLNNNLLNKPLNRLFTSLQSLLIDFAYQPEDIASQLKHCTLRDLRRFQAEEFDSGHIEALFYGDWQQNKFEDFLQGIDLPGHTKWLTNNDQVLKLHHIKEDFIQLQLPHPDSAYVCYFQAQQNDLNHTAKLMLIESYLAGFYFDWMRNRKQLGYMVGTGYMPFNEHPGMAVYVQSPSASPEHIHRETFSCLEAYQTWLSHLSESQWTQCKANLTRQFNHKDVNLSVKSQRLWNAIGQNDTNFNYLHRLSDEIAAVTLNETIDYLNQLVSQKNHHVSLFSKGQNAAQSNFPGIELPHLYQYKSQP